MDELTKVRELRDGAPLPDRGRLVPGRMRLLDVAEGAGAVRRTGRFRRDWRFAAVGAALAVTASVVLAVNVVDTPDGSAGSPAGRQPTVSESVGIPTALGQLEAAARAAESVKGTEPRDDQWYYTKSIGASVERDGGAKLGKARTDEDWFTVGPRKGEETDWRDYYALITDLPDDPQGIVEAFKKAHPQAPYNSLDPKSPSDALYVIQMIARAPVTSLEGKGQAKLYRVLSRMEGIELVDHLVKDAAGRDTYAIRVKPGPKDRYSYELLLRPDTHQLVGQRMVVARDFTDHGDTAFFPGKWKAGDVMTTGADLLRTFVDHKNERP